MRKFADIQGTDRQSSVSNTETTLILCGYSRGRANTLFTAEIVLLWSYLLKDKYSDEWVMLSSPRKIIIKMSDFDSI